MSSYFQDEGLSSTGIKEILKSPAHYQYWFRNQSFMTDKAALRIGSALHSYVLDEVHNVAVFNETKTTGTKAWDRFCSERPDKIIITEEEHRTCAGMADALLGNSTIKKMMSRCRRESEIYKNIALEDGQVIPAKAKLDLIHPKAVIDIKTTGDSANAFHFSAKKFAYDIQGAWYQFMESVHSGQGLKPVFFLVVEKAPPHGIMIYEINQAKLDEAWEKCLEAMQIFANCRATGSWPSYSTEIRDLSW